MRGADPNGFRGGSKPPSAEAPAPPTGSADVSSSPADRRGKFGRQSAAPAAPAAAQEWRAGASADGSVTGAIAASPTPTRTPPVEASSSIAAAATEASAPGVSRRSRGVLLQYGAPAAVVAISLVVALGIAGVFASSHSGHPQAPASRNISPLPVSAAAGATPAPKPPAQRPRAARQTHRASKPAASNHVAPRSAAKPTAPATTPAPSVSRRVVAVSPPAAPAPPHVPARTPAPPRHTTPHQLSATRPTQRSGGPGRQSTGG
jgi:hypothetical protein